MARTVLITGASGAIGAAAARRFAAAGYNVALHYFKNRDIAEAAVDEISAYPVYADLRKSSEVSKMAEDVKKRFGGIDTLVNNAAIAQQKLFTDITEHEWDDMFDTNMKSMFLCTKAVAGDFVRRKSGSIINVSSIWGITGASCEVHYSASKAAVIGFTKALAKELGPSGIRVNCVAPGVIDTKMNALLDDEAWSMIRDETPLGIVGTPEDVAETIFFLASDSAKFITGQVISPNGGIVI